MAGTVFPPGTLGYARIQADRAMDRRRRAWDVAWTVLVVAALALGAAVIAGL